VRPGVLALQGDFAEHRRALEACGTDPIEVRTAADLEHVDALIIPGGGPIPSIDTTRLTASGCVPVYCKTIPPPSE